MTTIIVNSPIESRHPIEVVSAFGRGLSVRQQKILERLPKDGSQIIVNKRDVSMLDLSAFTAETGVEYGLFTNGGHRLIVRGNKHRLPLDEIELMKLKNEGYRWSGHTHPGATEAHLIPSQGDMDALLIFEQRNSVIYNDIGMRRLIHE